MTMLGWVDKMMEELSHNARLAIGGTLLLCAAGGAVYAAVYVESAEPCQVRSIGPFTNDRTHECPAKPGGQTGTMVPDPVESGIPQHPSPERLRASVEVLAPGHWQEEMRKAHGLMLIEAELESLDSMPSGTYAYVWGGTFATHWREGHSRLTVRRSMRAEYFEIEKRKDGRAFLIGFVRGDVAKAIAEGTDRTDEIKVYARPYGKTDVVIAIPVTALASVGQDEITFPNDAIIPVLELTLKDA